MSEYVPDFKYKSLKMSRDHYKDAYEHMCRRYEFEYNRAERYLSDLAKSEAINIDLKKLCSDMLEIVREYHEEYYTHDDFEQTDLYAEAVRLGAIWIE